MDPERADRAAATAEDARESVVKRAGELSAILERTAQALEHSAEIAEEHAERRRRSGDDAAAAKEHAAATRATDAAKQARARAEHAAGVERTGRDDLQA